MVHQFKNNGYNVVMDTVSNSIHLMDDAAYDLLSFINNDLKMDRPQLSEMTRVCGEFSKNNTQYDTDTITEAYEEINELYESGELFCPDKSSEEISAFISHKPVIKAACLNVSHDCNLSCKYCFASEGEYHGVRELMDLDTGKAALDFLINHSGFRKNLEVDFFGGEPLLNFQVVKELVAYGRKIEKETHKHFRFTMTTNAVLLDDDIINFSNENFDNVVLSLDGRKSVHDGMRPFRGGQGSYDTVVPKIQDFVSKRGTKKHYIRGTFTGKNLDFASDILHMAELGFKEISMEPVVAPKGCGYEITSEDVSLLKKEYDRLAIEMADRQGTDKEFNFFHFMVDLTGGPCIYKRLAGCGAGTEYVAIVPGGDIYPCHQFVGMPDFKIGNVKTGLAGEDIISKFRETNVYTKPGCRDCFANMFCSGGCMANAYNEHGDINAVYEIGCELERKRVECAIMLEINKKIKNKGEKQCDK